LRALASVISDDIKRTRRVNDPIAMVGQGSTKTCPTPSSIAPVTPNQPCYVSGTKLPVSGVPTCFIYGYTGLSTAGATFNYRSVRLSSNNIVLDQATFDPNAVSAGTVLPRITGCSSSTGLIDSNGALTNLTAYQLNSTEVKITSLCFSSSSDTGSCYFNSATGVCALNTTVPVGNEIDVCISGQLQSGDAYTKTITRAFVQPIFVRSSAI